MLIWTPVTEFISDINPHEFHAKEEKNIRPVHRSSRIFTWFASTLHVTKINFLSFKIDDRVESILMSILSEKSNLAKHKKRPSIEIYSNLLSETQSNSIVIEIIKTRKNASFIIDKIGIPGYARTRGWVTINERLLKQPLIAVIAWNKSR